MNAARAERFVMTILSIGVLFGGMSPEHEVSCVSAASVLRHIDPDRFLVYRIGITKDGRQFLYEGDLEAIRDGSWEEDKASLIPAVLSPCPAHHGFLRLDKEAMTFQVVRLDCVLPILHGKNGEDGVMQGLLELSGIPYAGADTRSSAVCMDKTLTKLILTHYGVPQADFFILRKGEESPERIEAIEQRFSYPLFVKPASTGSSVGISKAKDRTELRAAMKKAFSYEDKILCEEYIPGAEVEVAVLERIAETGERELIVAQAGEIDPNSDFYDYDTKYKTDTARYFIPARISASAMRQVLSLAKRIFTLLDCRGFARVDFFVFGDTVVFNEINTIPGFTGISMYPKLMAHHGIPYRALLTRLIERAVGEDSPEQPSPGQSPPEKSEERRIL